MHKVLEKIENERINRRLSKSKLAKLVGIPASSYLNWVKGKSPTLENIEKVLRALGIIFVLGETPEAKEESIPDEYKTANDGTMVGITWSEENPKKLLLRINQLEKRVNQLEKQI